jgi:hypothetical protein
MATAAGEKAVARSERREGLIPQEELKAIIALDETLQQGKRAIVEAEQSGSLMLKGLMTARVAQQVRSMISPAMMRDVMALMNSPLGFKTDRGPNSKLQAYSEEVVRDVVIAALMDDARLVGNEFNIIAGNYYRTKEQLERKVKEFPGLREFRYSLAVPQSASGGALVAGWASWKLNGVADRIDCVQAEGFDSRIPVRVNEGQGSDAILGKATRKLLYRVLKRLTGQDLGDAEADEAPGDNEAIDASYTVQDPPTDETGDPSPVWAFEPRFAEAKSAEAADGILADVLAEQLDDESTALAKAWHAEAVKRLSARETVVEHDADAQHPLAGVWQRMEAAQTKSEVERIYLEASRIKGLSDADAKTLYQWRGQQMARIHGSRGERSNPKRQAAEVAK